MRVVLDACVLFPSVMRRMLLGAAAAGGFAPVWSARILEEWARATRRLPAGAEAVARADIARMRATWPQSEVAVPEELIARLSLPDADDRHVLGAAIAAGAETLLTLNRLDFPSRTLARHGVLRREPDGLLLELGSEGLDLAALAETVRGGREGLRPMLKRAGMPRVAKAVEASRTRWTPVD